VRGHFATSLYASLSRSQTDFGGPSTFGLEVTRYPYAYDAAGKKITQEELEAQAKRTKKDTSGVSNGSSFALGSMIDRGCFNYRWPVTEYYLELHPYQEAIETAKTEKSQASPLSTIIEGPEEPGASENERDGNQLPAQNPPPGETSNGSNDPTGALQHTRVMSSEQADTTVNEDTDTQPHAPNTPPRETPTAQKAEERGRNVGTCQMFSCAMGKLFYQILRIEELRASEKNDFEMSFPADSQIVLTMGGPVCKYIAKIPSSILSSPFRVDLKQHLHSP
jgi:hypothetical protein